MSSSTEEQERVIQNMDKNTMVIACPVEWQILHHEGGNKSHFSTSSIGPGILVTFTRAATDSLKNSLQKMIEPRFLNRIEVDTFHGFIKNGKPDRLERRASNRTQTNGDGITGTKTS